MLIKKAQRKNIQSTQRTSEAIKLVMFTISAITLERFVRKIAYDCLNECLSIFTYLEGDERK